MASAMRASLMRAAALQLRRQTPQTAAAMRATSYPQSAVAQTQLRSMSVFSNIKKTVSGKLEERNQLKQGGLAGAVQ